jgi:hypothetical protein
MNYEAGILYVSTGQKYNLETVRSAKSAKSLMPSIPIVLFTDQQPNVNDSSLFDKVNIIRTPSFSFADKIQPLKETPFKKTLFVDTDTVFVDSVVELFQLLDRFDLAYCHAPYRVCPGENNRIREVPDCFPEANTGVLAYRNSQAFRLFVDEWDGIYSEQRKAVAAPNHDQPAFRKALYFSPISSYVLPPEYNLRTPMPMYKGSGLTAKILHGRGSSLEQAIQRVGESGQDFGLYDFSYKLSLKTRVKRLISRRFIGRGKNARR